MKKNTGAVIYRGLLTLCKLRYLDNGDAELSLSDLLNVSLDGSVVYIVSEVWIVKFPAHVNCHVSNSYRPRTKATRAKLIYYLFTLTFLFNAFSILVRRNRPPRFVIKWVYQFSASFSLSMFLKDRPSGLLPRRNSVFTSSTLMHYYERLQIDLWLKTRCDISSPRPIVRVPGNYSLCVCLQIVSKFYARHPQFKRDWLAADAFISLVHVCF